MLLDCDRGFVGRSCKTRNTPMVYPNGKRGNTMRSMSFMNLHLVFLCILQKFNNLQYNTVKLGIKELFDKEQIGIKEPFPVTNLPFTS